MIKMITKSLLLTISITGLMSCSSNKWRYQGEKGPQNWGTISEDYSSCVNGKEQSPIDISYSSKGSTGPIDFNYGLTELKIMNTGNNIEMIYSSGSTASINKTTYDLKQLSFHTPSENTLAGKSYPLEMQLIHDGSSNSKAIISVLFKEGKENKILKKIWADLPFKEGELNTTSGHRINAASLLPAKTSYFNWKGSLTAPPCTEQVAWYLLTSPLTASKKQIERLLSLTGKNNRPTQTLNGRTIYFNK